MSITSNSFISYQQFVIHSSSIIPPNTRWSLLPCKLCISCDVDDLLESARYFCALGCRTSHHLSQLDAKNPFSRVCQKKFHKCFCLSVSLSFKSHGTHFVSFWICPNGVDIWHLEMVGWSVFNASANWFKVWVESHPMTLANLHLQIFPADLDVVCVSHQNRHFQSVETSFIISFNNFQ